MAEPKRNRFPTLRDPLQEADAHEPSPRSLLVSSSRVGLLLALVVILAAFLFQTGRDASVLLHDSQGRATEAD